MPVDDKFVIHSKGGEIGRDGLTPLATVDQIVSELQRSAHRHLIVHFHGGLVSREAGLATAQSWFDVYSGAGYPVFFVWESGAWETIRNNITELADEPVFKQLVRKLLEYALKRLAGVSDVRSVAPGRIKPDAVKEELDLFISNPAKETVPYWEFRLGSSTEISRSTAEDVDEAEIRADLEGDSEFVEALGTLPDIPQGRRSADLVAATTIVRDTQFSRSMSEVLGNREGKRGIISLFTAAMFVKNTLVGILRRYHRRRDHGLYATVVEEIIRSIKLGGSSLNEWAKAVEWNRMKKDCEDAFQPGADRFAGTALLTRLRDCMHGGRDLNRITLVGHSTGGVYICAWIDAAASMLAPEVTFDVVLLAPAVTYERFAATLRLSASRINGIRMFAMSDELERDDQVWGNDSELPAGKDWRRFIYPSSLLYLVSGILESTKNEFGTLIDEPDKPLLGMQRFLSEDGYPDVSFPELAYVRRWLSSRRTACVWSYADNKRHGLNSLSNDHSAFNTDAATRASLEYILRVGF